MDLGLFLKEVTFGFGFGMGLAMWNSILHLFRKR